MSGFLTRLFKGASDYARLASFFEANSDPWVRLRMKVPPNAFGLASHREFCAYLDGPTRVNVSSVEEICDWLRGCEAVDDQTLFLLPDFWQHPATFEQLRKGDCEDHALWAWRKLRKIGLPALFTAGVWRGVTHAWAQFEQNGVEFILESTAKTGPMIQPVALARSEYCPALAVDNDCVTYVYQGYPRFRACLGAAAPGIIA